MYSIEMSKFMQITKQKNDSVLFHWLARRGVGLYSSSSLLQISHLHLIWYLAIALLVYCAQPTRKEFIQQDANFKIESEKEKEEIWFS